MKLFGIAGWSGSGKTTLLTRLLPVLVGRGVEVATIKHTHHNPAIGNDESRALAAAGASETLFAGPDRFALIQEFHVETEADLDALARRVSGVDLLLIEGFKFAGHPKIEVWNHELGKPLLVGEQPSVVAVAADRDVDSHGRPLFRRDAVQAIADFIQAY